MIRKVDILTKVIIPIIAASLSGVGVWYLTSDWEKKAIEHGWISSVEWKQEARRQQWIPKEECPANPVKLHVTSPGDNTIVPFGMVSGQNMLLTTVIIASSKPIGPNDRVGVIIKPNENNNYYIELSSNISSFGRNADRKIFSNDYVHLPCAPINNMKLKIYGILVTESKIGTIYSDLNQIMALTTVLAISDPINVILRTE